MIQNKTKLHNIGR